MRGMSKMVKKKYMFIVVFSFCLVFISIYFTKINKVSAAYQGYYSTYRTETKIENDDMFSATQGMTIAGDTAYYVKVSNSKDYVTAPSHMWAYDFRTKKKQIVYNDKYTTFKIGHANSLCVKDNYMYIATMISDGPSIYRYKIENTSTRCKLTNQVRYKVYSSNNADAKLMSIAGIEYAPELNGFLVKTGTKVYLGNFNGDKFVWTKYYKIDTDITCNTNKGVENIDVGNGNFIKQGMSYRNGKVYMPMTNASKMNQSIVIVYPINSSMPSGTILRESSDTFMRITSTTYSKLFEIEDVAYYNGQMYANVNAIDNYGRNSDRIIQINDFSY